MAEVTDEEIDGLNMPKALKLARENNISLKGLRELELIKCELKKHLLRGRRNRGEVIEGLMTAAREDSKVRHQLINIYQKTINSIECQEELLLKSVCKYYKNANVIDLLKKQKGKLDGEISRCPVLVLGDTGAGKSSFINLLLGQEVFPCSLLSNTSVICEIAYCEVPYAILYPHDDELNDKTELETIKGNTMEDFDIKKLSRLVQERDEVNKRSKYKKAEIFIPLQILKTGLIIVDSPGVGDTPEMTRLVLDYIMEASAFVFIINTIDGVQITRLEMLLSEIVNRVLKGDNYFRQDCTLFICNKWDQVPLDERSKVYLDAEKKLKKAWIGFKPSNLYTLSTKEALWIQKGGHIVGRFEQVLQGIINLLPPSRKNLLTSATGILSEFLDNCTTCIESKIHRSTGSVIDIKIEKEEIQGKMESIRSEVIQFFEEQKSGLKSNLGKMVEGLSKHLRSNDVMEDLSNFSADDPEFSNKSFHEVSVIIRSRVYDRITKHIKSWEDKERKLEDVGKELIKDFRVKFPEFETKLFRVEKLFRSNWSTDGSDTDSPMEDSNPLVPNVIAHNFSNLNVGLKVILGVALSPVFLIGVIVRLPYWGFKQLATVIKNEMMTRDFEKGNNKDKVVKKYALALIEKMTEKNVIDACLTSRLSELHQYIDHQKQKVIDQINSKMAIMMGDSDSDDPDPFNASWVNSKATIDALVKNVEYFNMMFLPENLQFHKSDRYEVEGILSNGIMAEVVVAKDTVTNQRVALRQSRMEIDYEKMRQYQKEERYYRKSGKPKIITVQSFVKNEMHVWQCFTCPNTNLRQFMKSQNFPEFDNSKLQYYYEILSQVAKGLQYLHGKGLVHIDLSQETVMVNSDKQVILTNLSCPTVLDPTLFQSSSKNVEDYTHFPYDVLCNTSMTVYEAKHDMYSLGILMLEFWAQKPAFSTHIFENKIENLEQLCSFLKNFDIKSCLPSVHDSIDITSIERTWYDVTVHCISGSGGLTADKWLDIFSHEASPDRFTQLYTRLEDVQEQLHVPEVYTSPEEELYCRITHASL